MQIYIHVNSLSNAHAEKSHLFNHELARDSKGPARKEAVPSLLEHNLQIEHLCRQISSANIGRNNQND